MEAQRLLETGEAAPAPRRPGRALAGVLALLGGVGCLALVRARAPITAALAAAEASSRADAAWAEFKTKYAKRYATPEEEASHPKVSSSVSGCGGRVLIQVSHPRQRSPSSSRSSG